MNIRNSRPYYRPFEYPQAEDYFMKQQQAHWLHTEVNMSSDVNDWSVKLTPAERQLVGNVLKGFTQAEVLVGEYWGQKVSAWFPKPEIQSMASTFAAFEAIHAAAYGHLNTSLGLEDFQAFLYAPEARAKIDAMLDVDNSDDPRSVLSSLGTYSGFVEGVSLFSSFSMLLAFSQRNLLKGVGQIVSWSVRDESLHSRAGCWLYREYAKECGLLEDLRPLMEERALEFVRLEEDFIDMCMSVGTVEGQDSGDLKNMIRHRANSKLEELGARPVFDVDADAMGRMRWFDIATAGVEHQDFFAMRPTSYSKGQTDWSSAW